MAEKSIRIADDPSGLRLATRDAFEPDGTHGRVIERVDLSSGKFSDPIGDPLRGASTTISGTDPLNLGDMPSDYTSNILSVGDKSMLCVAVKHTASDGHVTITPILYDNTTNSPVAVADSQTTSVDDAFYTTVSGEGTYYYSPVITWDVLGAYRIGLHVTDLGGTNNKIKVYGWVV